jgi:hypothetical protein
LAAGLAALFALFGALGSAARAQSVTPPPAPEHIVAEAPEGGTLDDEFPWPDVPIPDKGRRLPADDTLFLLAPAPELDVRAGYAGYGDTTKFNHGGGLGVVIFLDGGRTGLYVSGTAAMGEGGPFAYGEGALRFRYRHAFWKTPVGNNDVLWIAGGLGLDIAGRGTPVAQLDSWLTTQLPVALIGTMFSVNKKCVIHIFGKTAFGVFDNQTQAQDKWGASLDTMARPSVGAEVLTQCGTIRVLGDYQHIFTFGPAGDTDKATLQVSQTWPVFNGLFQLGYFAKGDVAREGPAQGASPSDPRGRENVQGGVFSGLELRF